MLKKIGFAGVGLAFLVSPLFASAATLADLQAQLQAALVQLQLAIGQGAVLGAATDDTPEDEGSVGIYCPQLSQTLKRGMRDTQTVPPGQVSELQTFITDYYSLDENIVVGGYFGRLTHKYVVQFQQEQGLPAYGIVGSLTRAKIAEVCGKGQTGSFRLIAPNGGEVWRATPTITDTISGYEQYTQSISWVGAPEDAGYSSDRVRAYLEQWDGGVFVRLGRIPAFAVGSIRWVVGIVNTKPDCQGAACLYNTTIVGPGQYYIFLVDNGTGATDRSDAPFTITNSATPSPYISNVSPSHAGAGTTITLTGTGLAQEGTKDEVEFLQNGILRCAVSGPRILPERSDTMLKFNFTDSFAANCPPGLYQIRWNNGLVMTNSVNFTIDAATTLRSRPTLALDALSPLDWTTDARLLRFKITAANTGPIGIGKFTFSQIRTGITVQSLTLYGYTDAGYTQPIAGQGVGGQITGSIPNPNSQVSVNVVNGPIEIAAGATNYFELRGTFSGVGSGAQITSTLMGDSSAQPLTTAANTLASNFVWTPNTTGTTMATDADWTNGYSVPGLPASGLVQVRSGGTSNVTFTATPTSGAAPLSVQFGMKGLNLTGSPTSYIVYFGDNSTPYSTSVIGSDVAMHTYTQPGAYTAHLNKKTAPTEETELATVNVTVSAPMPPPTVSMSINGQAVTTIAPGAQFSVDWSSSNATSCTITNAQGQAGSTPPNVAGSSSGAAPAAGTIYTYMITCTNSAGSVSQSASLVSGTGGTVGLTANGQLHLVYPGANYTLAYTSSNVQSGSCTMSYSSTSNGSGSFPVDANVYRTAQSGLIGTYTMTCKKMDGQDVSATVTVTAS
ncbi:peptidoglycan-binding protein [Candidatus Kaiserbacteria bacterium]|nr:peptidoglycan-binding protein [Candidatus Kaiserbacteria bacterium]